MKKLFENWTDGSKCAVLCVLNFVLVLTAALVVKAFNADVSVFAGGGFVVGFVAVIVEFCIFGRKGGDVPIWCVIGTMVGSIYAYFLGI